MAIKPQTGGGQAGNTTAQDIVGAALGTITKRLTALEDADRGLTTSVVTIPEVDYSFTPVYRRDKKGVFVTLAFFIPPTTTGLRVSLIRTADRTTDADFQENRFGENLRDIEDVERAAGRIVREIPVRLYYSTQYDLFRLRATTTDTVGEQANIFNPDADPLFTDVPLLQFTTPEAFGVPSSPDAALILKNELDPTTKDYDGYVVVRIHAPLNLESGVAQTYRQAGVDHVVAKFTRTGTSERPTKSHILSEAELDQVDAASTPPNRGYVDVTIRNFRPGTQYTWDVNVAWTNGEKKNSTGPPVTLYGAGLRLGTDGLPELTAVSLTPTVDGDVPDSTMANVLLAFTQSTPPIALRKVALRWKKTVGGAYPDDGWTRTLHKDSFHTAGTPYTILFTGIKIKPRRDWDFQCIITGEGDVGAGIPPKRTVTATLDATVLNDPSTPAAPQIVSNQLDPSTKEHDALVVFRVHAPLTDGGAAQSFRLAQVEKVWVQLQRVSTGDKRKDGGALTETELDQVDAGSTPANRGYVDIMVSLKVADFLWIANIAEGLGETHTATASIAFKAGGLATAAAGIPELTSVSLSTDQTEPFDGKNTLLKLNFTQPATPVALRYCDIEVSTDGGAIYKLHTEHISLKSDTLHTAGAHIVSLATIRTKKLTNNKYRVIIKAQGGETRTVTLDEVAADGGDATATPGALAFPGSLTENTVDGDPEKSLARVSVIISTVSGTFAANNIAEVGLFVIERDQADTVDIGKHQFFSRPTLYALIGGSSVRVEFYLRIGGKFRITDVTAINGDKSTDTAGSLLFTAGGVIINPAVAPAPTYQVALAADGNKHVTATLRVAQNGTDIILFKKLVIMTSTGGGGYERVQEIGLKHEDSLYLTNASFKDFPIRVHRKPSATIGMRAFLIAVGPVVSANADQSLGALTDDGATTPTAIAFPSAPSGSNNTVDGDPDGAQARIALTLATVSGTFTANNVSQIEIVMIRRNSTNTADVGDPFSQLKVLSTADLALTSVVHEFFLKIGVRFRITKVIARNGDKRAETTGTADFVAGGFILDGTCPAPSFQVQPTADGNKQSSFTVRLVNTNPPVLFKSLLIEKSYAGSGVWKSVEGGPVPLKSDDALNVASATKDFPFFVTRKPGVTLDVRATARMVGAVSSSTTNATQLAAGTDDMSADTAAPSGLAAPTIDWTAAGRLRIRGMSATTNIHSLKKKYLVITDGAGTYLDITTRAAAANEAAARFEIGLKSHITLPDIKKKHYSTVFGSSGNVIAYWYAENDINVSSASSNSNTLTVNTFGEVMSDTLDAVKVIDVSSLMSAPDNLVKNGDAGNSTGTSTTLNVWRRYDKTSNIDNSPGTTALTTTSADLHWDQTNHAIIHDGNASSLVQKLRSLVPGDDYTISFMAKRVGTVTDPVYGIGLIKQGSATNETDGTVTMTLTNLSTSVYKMYGQKFRLATSADGSLPHWLDLRTLFALDTSNYVIFDRIVVARGKTPYSYFPNVADPEDFTVAPASIGTSPDVGDPTGGSQGGFGGGEFNVN